MADGAQDSFLDLVFFIVISCNFLVCEMGKLYYTVFVTRGKPI